jgi:3-hydroxybutyryl-CoA dehydrogenase
VVRAAAAPGFIVNRIARPFYAEAWRLYEARAAAPEVIDAVLTGAGGFRMGPFALMDLVGHDVNEAVTRSVWSAFGHDPRYTPSLAQRALVEGGRLGRKSGRGVYPADGAPTALPAGPGQAPPSVTVLAETGRAENGRAETGRAGTGRAETGRAGTGHGETPLWPLLDRGGVPVVTRESGHPDIGLPGGLVELPSGALLVQCAGATATGLAAAAERPVVVVDRALDYTTASAVAIAPSDGCPEPALSEATGLLQAAGLSVYVIEDVPGMVVTRTVAMLVNSAADALAAGVASAADIDTAMRLGVNYPLGPLDWGRRWGTRDVLTVLDSLENWYRDGHYRASSPLRRAALSGRDL